MTYACTLYAQIMDPTEDTARNVAAQLKQELRAKLQNAMSVNKKCSVARSQEHIAEVTIRTLQQGRNQRKPQTVSVGEASEQLGAYRSLLLELDSMLASGGGGRSFGPQGKSTRLAECNDE